MTMQDKQKHRLNHYLEEKYFSLENVLCYPLDSDYQMDSVIKLFNNLGQFFSFCSCRKAL